MSLPEVKPIIEIIRWWERELTSANRDRLMGDYVWCGSVEERHKKLREMYEKFQKGED